MTDTPVWLTALIVTGVGLSIWAAVRMALLLRGIEAILRAHGNEEGDDE